jgi:lipopolysaccharide/colanic/teichoic acid biosynthesis glycosyltransferase
MDVTISFFGLLFLTPLFIYIAFSIKRDSPGPVFFRGPRVGRGRKVFQILKFRTMFERADSYTGPRVTAKGDSRITTIGRWLRDTKLNELPQLWNVLVGEMSLVGPRPEDPEVAARWPEPFKQEIFSVRPGITSPASVVYRDEETLLASANVMDDYLRGILPSKLRLDSLYVRSRSLITDMDVLFWTLIVLLPQMRRRPVEEHDFYWGPLRRFIRLDFSWFLVDFPIALFSVVLTGVLMRTMGPLDIGLQVAPLVAFGIALSFSLINSVMGLNRVYWSKATPAEAIDLLVSSGLMTLVLIGVDIFLLDLWIPIGLLVTTGVLSFLGFVAVRYRERLLTGAAARWLHFRGGLRTVGERVLIVGAGDVAQFATWLVRKSDLSGFFTIVGLLDDDPAKQGMRIDGLKVLGLTENLPDIVERMDIGLVLFAISNIDEDDRLRILELCRSVAARVVLVPDMMQTMRSYFAVDNLDAVLAPADAGEQDGMVASDHVAAWLNELEDLAQLGDLEAVRESIQRIRSKIEIDEKILE